MSEEINSQSRTFEQQMIERDNVPQKPVCCWRYGSADCGTGARRRGRDVAAEQTDVELYTLDNHTGRVDTLPDIENQPDRYRSLSKGDGRN